MFEPCKLQAWRGPHLILLPQLGLQRDDDRLQLVNACIGRDQVQLLLRRHRPRALRLREHGLEVGDPARSDLCRVGRRVLGGAPRTGGCLERGLDVVVRRLRPLDLGRVLLGAEDQFDPLARSGNLRAQLRLERRRERAEDLRERDAVGCCQRGQKPRPLQPEPRVRRLHRRERFERRVRLDRAHYPVG